MKSNYMRSAEIKIAKDPSMSKLDKDQLTLNARCKELALRIAINDVYLQFDDNILTLNEQPNGNFTVTAQECVERLINDARIASSNYHWYDSIEFPAPSYNTAWRWERD